MAGLSKTFKYLLMAIVLCFLPVWAFLPIALGGVLTELVGPFIAVVVCIPFAVKFYGDWFEVVFEFLPWSS